MEAVRDNMKVSPFHHSSVNPGCTLVFFFTETETKEVKAVLFDRQDHTPEHVTYMSVAKAAHVTVRLFQDTGRQL